MSRPVNPGDHCRFLPNYEVEHWDCEEWGDGVVTSVLTGRYVRTNQ